MNRSTFRLPGLVLVLQLAACASQDAAPVDVPPDLIPPIAADTAPDIELLPPIGIAKRRLPPPPPVLPEPPGVAIVLASRTPAYEDVAIELSQRLGRYSIYDLSDKSQPAEDAFRLINDSDSGAVVAIGLPAARIAVALAQVPVVFSQVFNYRDDGLVTGNSRGVAALAPPEAQLGAWKSANPALTRIGAIIGPGHEALVDEAQIAADTLGVQLTVATVDSDQEALYQFRRMMNEIDGFWLFPDNRILSSRSLREIFAQARQRNVDVAVSNDALLTLGAGISISTVAADIADTIVNVIRRIEAGQLDDLPDLTPLNAIQVSTH